MFVESLIIRQIQLLKNVLPLCNVPSMNIAIGSLVFANRLIAFNLIVAEMPCSFKVRLPH